ncbi:enoyl-CoA hydratase/isomerase family protein [Pikeienuella piscinae]|uniref:Enoyl-CoA hydratase/isomerase family protein n=1 Tax=Pikeienuella piscinae TaxID=2748098 RepID=A0A7M3T650_9RHOB|nr:enoyl-CoA hydratase/isomerase family protein [Pikeienuella piscinae]QIE57481.1 enoyl-CoA hydratase/isomerase family protein [Pikeienuella piscinae]
MKSDPHVLESIQLEIREGVGWLRFNRPPVNAFDWRMLNETRLGFDTLDASEDVRIIVLGSALGSHLSSGADLTVFRETTPEQMREWIAISHALARRMRASEKPLLAAIKGVAVGGGLEMCLHADLRFADPDAKLGQPEINIAFIPPVAGTQALVRLIGRSAAFRMLYSGEIISAAQALTIGLVDTLSAPGAVDAEVQALALDLARKPGNALAAIRRCLIGGGGADFEDGLSIEATEAGRLAAHANFREGVAAFLSKRPPRWER